MEMFKTCFRSVLESGAREIVVVSPTGSIEIPEMSPEGPTVFQLQEDRSKGGGAASAINQGLSQLMDVGNVDLIGWIGDDDELVPEGIQESLLIFKTHPDSSAVVGACETVDETGHHILFLRPRPIDVQLLNFKGNKLPQPGSIFALKALREVGLLDTTLTYAFDQDLFHRLRLFGTVRLNSEIVSRFRWHPASLSSGGEAASLEESIKVRLRYTALFLRSIVLIHGMVAKLAHHFGVTRLP